MKEEICQTEQPFSYCITWSPKICIKCNNESCWKNKDEQDIKGALIKGWGRARRSKCNLLIKMINQLWTLCMEDGMDRLHYVTQDLCCQRQLWDVRPVAVKFGLGEWLIEFVGNVQTHSRKVEGFVSFDGKMTGVYKSGIEKLQLELFHKW